MGTKSKSVTRIVIGGISVTEDQAEVYNYLKRQKKPKTPQEVGDGIGKTRKAAWKLLDSLVSKDLVAKTNAGRIVNQTDDAGNVIFSSCKGQGKYYVPGSGGDPDHPLMKRVKERMKSGT